MEVWTVTLVAGLGMVSVLACSFCTLFYCFPHHLVKLFLIIRRYKAGMRVKYIRDGSTLYCYGERGMSIPHKASIVFIHGFTSSKDQWINIFKNIPKDFHLVALDLPGHGGSSIPDEDVELNFEFVTQRFNKFFDKMELSNKKMHIVGASLGGAIVGLYAAMFPEKIEKVTLVCPAVMTPIESAFAVQVKEATKMGRENITTENCSLLPTTVEDLKSMLAQCCYYTDILKLSDQLWKGFLKLRLEKTDFYLRLYKSVATLENLDMLLRVAPKIVAPSQIIWGKNDQLIHVSGAEVLRSKLSNCKCVDIIDQCGHAIDIDRPGTFCKYLLKFANNDFGDNSSEISFEKIA